MQLVLQHCWRTSWKAMLRVFLATFNPVNNLICCKTGLIWLVKHATSLFNLFCSIVAWQVACFLLPVFRTLRAWLSRHLSYKRNKNSQRCDFMTTKPAQLVRIPVLWCRVPDENFQSNHICRAAQPSKWTKRSLLKPWNQCIQFKQTNLLLSSDTVLTFHLFT